MEWSKAMRFWVFITVCIICLLTGCGKEEKAGELQKDSRPPGIPIEKTETMESDILSAQDSPEQNLFGREDIIQPESRVVLNPEGMTLEARVLVPDGYERVPCPEGSLTDFLRSYPVKEAGAKVHLYDGREKAAQGDHVAVFDLPIENYDLQQCADSVMRMYAEYFWSTGQFDRIAFHFTNGFLADYITWRDGGRIQVDGNQVSWQKSAGYDDSYECFVKYLKVVFCYAGTLSMNTEAKETSLEELKPGDVFLYGGSPGHVVMVVDVCENPQGQKAFLLGQGYMPAQEFHLLKNELHEDDPWYYQQEVTYPFQTPEYVFQENSLKKLIY